MKISHLLFDLDNTLYPSSSQMDAGITRRMLECVAEYFKCDFETAVELRKINIIHYSTTLEWLRAEGFKNIEAFFAHVHPEYEANELQPQPGLRDFLLSLDYPKSILTNAPMEHAERVLQKLGISDLFDNITDIRDAKLLGKPYPHSYSAALKKSGTDLENTLFFDDMQKYTDGWTAMGGTAILIGNKNGRPLSDDAESLLQARKMNSGRTGKTIKLSSIYDFPAIIDTLKD